MRDIPACHKPLNKKLMPSPMHFLESHPTLAVLLTFSSPHFATQILLLSAIAKRSDVTQARWSLAACIPDSLASKVLTTSEAIKTFPLGPVSTGNPACNTQRMGELQCEGCLGLVLSMCRLDSKIGASLEKWAYKMSVRDHQTT